MLDPIVKKIEVSCSQEKAFRIFWNEMDSWWPLGKFTVSAMGGKPAKAIRVDAKPGGKIVEIGPDGTEHLWGTIKSYDPHDFVSMDFHIPQPTEQVKSRSLVEVRFTALGKDRTRVELTQSNWEALGEWAAMLRGGYGKGWAVIQGLGGYFRAGIQNGLRRLNSIGRLSPQGRYNSITTDGSQVLSRLGLT